MFMGEKMKEKKIQASYINGGITEPIIKLYKEGLARKLTDGQIFDIAAIESLRSDINHQEISISEYANIHSKGCMVNVQDIAFLGATEIDVNFHCNVNTHSDGLLLHGIGGHQDVAAGSRLSIMLAPSFRKRIPIILDNVVTVTTPGETVDCFITERGIAINPLRKDLIEHYKNSKLPFKTIEKIRDEVISLCGRPKPPKLGDRVIALIEYRDGTIVDTVREVLP
jgi:citrate lyase subunit alpha/citrate CoA-transferase